MLWGGILHDFRLFWLLRWQAFTHAQRFFDVDEAVTDLDHAAYCLARAAEEDRRDWSVLRGAVERKI